MSWMMQNVSIDMCMLHIGAENERLAYIEQAISILTTDKRTE
jgi:hypothetical protein